MKTNEEIIALFSVFSRSVVTHDNLGIQNVTQDNREHILLRFINYFLTNVLEKNSVDIDREFSIQEEKALGKLQVLMQDWEKSIKTIYSIRNAQVYERDHLIGNHAKNLVEKVSDCNNIMIIPTGLMRTGTTKEKSYHHVSCSIIEKKGSTYQVKVIDPGAPYHQYCIDGNKYKTVPALTITDIPLGHFTQTFFKTLITLKAVEPHYKYSPEIFYELLWARLNGKTVTESTNYKNFVDFSEVSPCHTWEVICYVIRYVVTATAGIGHDNFIENLVIEFKLSLAKQIYDDYVESKKDDDTYLYLLHESSHDIAHDTLRLNFDDKWSESIIKRTRSLIETIKKEIFGNRIKKYLIDKENSKFGMPHLKNTIFPVPQNILDLSGYDQKTEKFEIQPRIAMPEYKGDLIGYFKQFESSYIQCLEKNMSVLNAEKIIIGIEKLIERILYPMGFVEENKLNIDSGSLEAISQFLLSYSQLYYNCQNFIINKCGRKDYDPSRYAMMTLVNFFCYAGIITLCSKDSILSKNLQGYSFSQEGTNELTFEKLLNHLVIKNRKWVVIAKKIRRFFVKPEGTRVLFNEKFSPLEYRFRITNESDSSNTLVSFCQTLLPHYPNFEASFLKWSQLKENRGEEKKYKRFSQLAYGDNYLPSLLKNLRNMAYHAKVSLRGFSVKENFYNWSYDYRSIRVGFSLSDKNYQHYTEIIVEGYERYVDLGYFFSYSSLSSNEKFQRLISHFFESKLLTQSRLTENEVIASQHRIPDRVTRERYFYLGFLRSNINLVYHRLYIALKRNMLSLEDKNDCLLIKQVLFEVASIHTDKQEDYSHLEHFSVMDPRLQIALIKLLSKELDHMLSRPTQHHVLADILDIVINLRSFCLEKAAAVIDGQLFKARKVLKEWITEVNKTSSLDEENKQNLVCFYAYLIISYHRSKTLSSEALKEILCAKFEIEKKFASNITLPTVLKLQVIASIMSLEECIHTLLEKDSSVLNNIVLLINQNWQPINKQWMLDEKVGCYRHTDYAIEPYTGKIYFQNEPILSLSEKIYQHEDYKEYLGKEVFPCIKSKKMSNDKEIYCYESVDRNPQIRLTAFQQGDSLNLMIEERVEGHYQQFLPKRLFNKILPKVLINNCMHWRAGMSIFIKNSRNKILYHYHLKEQLVRSAEDGLVLLPDQKGIPFKHLEITDYLLLFANKVLDDTKQPSVEKMHFVRLGLSFSAKKGAMYSNEIKGYKIAPTQVIDTLHGFSQYLILENCPKHLDLKEIMLIIPHRQLVARKHFIVAEVSAGLRSVFQPGYFSYRYDSTLGILKGDTTSANLYLALLYAHLGSLDRDLLTQQTHYSNAIDVLDHCWRNFPYYDTELSIIERFVDVIKSNPHPNSLAVWLKVIALLLSSVRVSFLYQKANERLLIEKTETLLKEQIEKNDFVTIFYTYLKYQHCLDIKCRLSQYNESLILEKALSLSKQRSEYWDKEKYTILMGYQKALMEKQPLSISSTTRNYKNYYHALFSKKPFVSQTYSHISIPSTHQVALNIGDSIHQWTGERMRFDYFLSLYNQALMTTDLENFKYKLHYLCLRARPTAAEMEMNHLIARALMIVATFKDKFPPIPYSITGENEFTSEKSMDLSDLRRCFSKLWLGSTYGTNCYPDYARNHFISLAWKTIKKHDLDSFDRPIHTASDLMTFGFRLNAYGKLPSFNNNSIVFSRLKEHCLVLAKNQVFNRFILKIMRLCDTLKFKMGDDVSLYESQKTQGKVYFNKLPVFSINSFLELPAYQTQFSYEIDITHFFSMTHETVKSKPFPISISEKSGYGSDFIKELEKSWKTYLKLEHPYYDFREDISLSNIIASLKLLHQTASDFSTQTWKQVIALINDSMPKTISGDRLFLSRIANSVLDANRVAVLKLFVNIEAIKTINPFLFSHKDHLKAILLDLIRAEIFSAKIVRALRVIEDYELAASEQEKTLILQSIAKILSEKNDKRVYDNPSFLLFELEHKLLLRENQKTLTLAMANQQKKVMYQLNMGEGKSSVILILLGHLLANREKMVRISVLEPLLTFMQDLLTRRFGFLLYKQIYIMPFSRAVDITENNLLILKKEMECCRDNGHIVLVTPEHQLSFYLRLIETLIEYMTVSETDIFNWETYRQSIFESFLSKEDRKKSQVIEENQNKRLKALLVTLGYLDSCDKILKYPNHLGGLQKFRDEIYKGIELAKGESRKYIDSAYYHLRENSAKRRQTLKTRLMLLNQINQILAVDILDESDEILRHGTELNYSIGRKQPLDGMQYRWNVPQKILRIIYCNTKLAQLYEDAVKQGHMRYNISWNRSRGVPYIQFLDENYFKTSILPIVLDAFLLQIAGELAHFGYSAESKFHFEHQGTLKQYLLGKLKTNIERAFVIQLKESFPLAEIILTAKGWLSEGILFHVLHYRYRINYGIHAPLGGLPEKNIAIPYKGKDAPSSRSDFSHPDVMIGFSILAYLYRGLHRQQIKATLLHLKRTKDLTIADKILRSWVQLSKPWILSQYEEIPAWLNSFKSIDLNSNTYLDKLTDCLSHNIDLIYYFLDKLVFPQETDQFHYKISADAHTLAEKPKLIGFSGTDDRKVTMPDQVKSERITSQQSTNGKMLHIMLRHKNQQYFSAAFNHTKQLLDRFCDYADKRSDVHILIDAGALVIGLSNFKVAEYLLKKLPARIKGVILFDDNTGRIMVLQKDKSYQPISSCHLPLTALFAYLDEIHTRGSDLKLPINSHGILTIANGMQKDKLMQAGMRLRQLDTGQSLSLWGSRELSQKLAVLCGKEIAEITSADVLNWVTLNTVEKINKDLFSVSLRKVKSQIKRRSFELLNSLDAPLPSLINRLREYVDTTLQHFFATTPVATNLFDELESVVANKFKVFWREAIHDLKKASLFDKEGKHLMENKKQDRKVFKRICSKVEDYLEELFRPIHVEFDQDEEKEVEMEIVEEVVQSLPEKQEAAGFSPWNYGLIFEDDFFIKSLTSIVSEYPTIMPVQKVLSNIDSIPGIAQLKWHKNIYASQNFSNTIQDAFINNKSGLFLRPVDMVMVHRTKKSTCYFLLSGREANEIKPLIEKREQSQVVLLHLDDINGKTMLPFGADLSEKEIAVLSVIKLFNGNCLYSLTEKLMLPRYFAIVSASTFIDEKEGITETIAKDILQDLQKNNYVTLSGSFTRKLSLLLRDGNNQTNVTLEFSKELAPYTMVVLNKLYKVSTKALSTSADRLQFLPLMIWKMVKLRSRIKRYAGSDLEEVLTPQSMTIMSNGR